MCIRDRHRTPREVVVAALRTCIPEMAADAPADT